MLMPYFLHLISATKAHPGFGKKGCTRVWIMDQSMSYISRVVYAHRYLNLCTKS